MGIIFLKNIFLLYRKYKYLLEFLQLIFLHKYKCKIDAFIKLSKDFMFKIILGLLTISFEKEKLKINPIKIKFKKNSNPLKYFLNKENKSDLLQSISYNKKFKKPSVLKIQLKSKSDFHNFLIQNCIHYKIKIHFYVKNGLRFLFLYTN